MFIKVTYKNEEKEEEDIVKYYVLDNKTDYKETIYYTLSNVDNKIVMCLRVSDFTYPCLLKLLIVIWLLVTLSQQVAEELAG